MSEPLRIHLGESPRNTRVSVGDTDISHVVRSVRIHSDHEHITTAIIEVFPREVVAELPPGVVELFAKAGDDQFQVEVAPPPGVSGGAPRAGGDGS